MARRSSWNVNHDLNQSQLEFEQILQTRQFCSFFFTQIEFEEMKKQKTNTKQIACKIERKENHRCHQNNEYVCALGKNMIWPVTRRSIDTKLNAINRFLTAF